MTNVIVQFPKKVRLIDTGERRHPSKGDFYMFADPKTGDIDGPHLCYDTDDDGWYGAAECYAIFRLEEA